MTPERWRFWGVGWIANAPEDPTKSCGRPIDQSGDRHIDILDILDILENLPSLAGGNAHLRITLCPTRRLLLVGSPKAMVL